MSSVIYRSVFRALAVACPLTIYPICPSLSGRRFQASASPRAQSSLLESIVLRRVWCAHRTSQMEY